MNYFYINETMLQDTAFSKNVLQRFLNYYYRHHGELLLISAVGELNLDMLPRDIHYIISPATFDMHGVKGELMPYHLILEDTRLDSVCSGTCIQFDTDTRIYTRLYFDIIDDPLIDLSNQIMEEIQGLMDLNAVKKHFLN